MRNSKIAPIIVGIILLIGGGLWAWLVMSIDYSRMNAQGSEAKPAVLSPAKPGE